MEAKAKLAMPVAKKETLEDDDDVETDVVNDVGDAKTDAQSNGIKVIQLTPVKSSSLVKAMFLIGYFLLVGSWPTFNSFKS